VCKKTTGPHRSLQKVQGYRAGFDMDVTPRTGSPVGRDTPRGGLWIICQNQTYAFNPVALCDTARSEGNGEKRSLQKVQGHRAGVDVDVTPPTGGPVGHPPNPATL